MKLKDFEALPLLKVFYSVDTATGDLLRHEVRRDPDTGLTLTAPRPDMGPNKETKDHD